MNLNERMMENITIDFAARTTWLTMMKYYNEQAGKFGSTMVFGFTLLSIDPKRGTPSTALGPKMGIEPTSLSRTLKNMQEKGLITKKPNPDDGRGVLICLTDFGLEMREISKKTVLYFNELIRLNIKEEDLKTYLEVSFKIQELIK